MSKSWARMPRAVMWALSIKRVWSQNGDPWRYGRRSLRLSTPTAHPVLHVTWATEICSASSRDQPPEDPSGSLHRRIFCKGLQRLPIPSCASTCADTWNCSSSTKQSDCPIRPSEHFATVTIVDMSPLSSSACPASIKVAAITLNSTADSASPIATATSARRTHLRHDSPLEAPRTHAGPNDFTDTQAIAAIECITLGNFGLLERLSPQIAAVLKIRELMTVTDDVIEVAASTLVIGT